MMTSVRVDKTPARMGAGRRRRVSGLRWLALPAAAIAGAGIWTAIGNPMSERSAPPVRVPRALPIGVSALGRLAPESDVIQVAPGSASDGGRVDRLLVAVGDRVEPSQVIAVLDTYRRRDAAVHEAEAKVAVARAKLAQVQAGAKPEDVRAQEALIGKYQAEVQTTEAEFARAALLYKRSACSRDDYDDHRLKYEQARESVNQAKAQRDALKAVRPTDVRTAEADLAQVEAGLDVARAERDAAEVRSPLAGRVLRIHVRPGERVGDQGIVEIGNTDVMHAVAEVYEEDVAKVSLGQTASVRVPTLGAALTGEVVRKDLVVGRKVIFNNDPVSDTDARVVEVRIRLAPEDGRKVAGLSNARVEAVIDVHGGTR